MFTQTLRYEDNKARTLFMVCKLLGWHWIGNGIESGIYRMSDGLCFWVFDDGWVEMTKVNQ